MNQQISYKYRFYPTEEQKILLAHTFGCKRYVYNHFLEYRSKQYEEHGESVSYYDTNKKLTELKQELEWLNDVSSVSLQQGLRDLDTAFKNFFKQRTRYPRYKKRNNHQSFRLTNSAFRFKNGQLYIAKCKTPLDARWSRNLDFTKINSITISKDPADRYFVSIQGEKDIKLKPVNNNVIGIDLGITHFLTDSNGIKIDNIRSIKRFEDKLRREQRKLSRKQRGSNNYEKQKLKVARVHVKTADVRNDFLQKMSTDIINENQVIIIEDLAVKNMVRNRKLSKAISDVSWGRFIEMLRYKALWYGRTLVEIDRWYPSSKTCSSCGHLHKVIPLSVRYFSCESCGEEHDRDINAAKNILTAGLAELACGDRGKTKAFAESNVLVDEAGIP